MTSIDPKLRNASFLQALLRQPSERRPVWLMRQAGRYLPEYMQIRQQAGSFMALAQNPELACEVTLQPLRRFDLDAAILFSDILTVPDALGLGLDFVADEGPVFARPLRDEMSVATLPKLDLERLRYVFDAVSLIRSELNDSVPLIGFSGSPWTLAAYMIEGSGSRNDFQTARKMLYHRPDLIDRILAANTAAVSAYLNAQIDAGAQAVMIFDTWGGLLADGCYQRYSLRYMAEIVASLRREAAGFRVPVLVYTKGGGQWLEQIANIGCDGIGLDWTVNLGSARQRVGDRVALQGNLDPAVLLSNPEAVVENTQRLIDDYGSGGGHVVNLGHGIQPTTPVENVAALINTVHQS